MIYFVIFRTPFILSPSIKGAAAAEATPASNKMMRMTKTSAKARQPRDEKNDDDDDDDDDDDADDDETSKIKKRKISSLLAFYKAKTRLGLYPSLAEMQKFCRERAIKMSAKALRFLRYKLKYTAMYSVFRKPLRYMGASFSKYGTVMIDMAFYAPELRAFNGGCSCFLVGVECLSGQLSVVACKNARQASWIAAIEKMVETGFSSVTNIISDRDASVTGAAFRRKIKKRWGIDWMFLTIRSKAFRAERLIRYCKERFSTALAASKQEGRVSRNWVGLIPGLVRDYNIKHVPGTDVRRIDVDARNYLDLLEEVHGSADPTAHFNAAQSGHYSKRVTKALWKYQMGDKVLLARSANRLLKKEKGSFEKPSVEGSFGPQIFTISRLRLKDSHYFLTPVYGLEEAPPKILFYESELKPALFAAKRPVAGSATAAAAAAAATDLEKDEKQNEAAPI
jgi:hypothetical protein